MSEQETTETTTLATEQLKFIDARSDAAEQTQALGSPAPITAFNRYAMPGAVLNHLDILKHPIRIAGFNWTPADPLGALLYEGRIPEIMANEDSFHRLLLETYAFFKPNLSLRFVMNSTKFHVGRLVISVDPFHQMNTSYTPYSSSKTWSRAAATGNPSTYLDASMSNVAEVKIPFEHIQDYLTTNSKETFDMMAILRVNVFNTLRVATGTQGTVNIQIFLQCDDVDLHVPIHPHLAVLPSFAPPIRADMQGGIVTKVSNIAEGAYNTVWNTVTGNFGKAATSAGSTLTNVGGLLSEFNLDKPSDPTASVVNTLSPFAPMSHGTGIDASVRLGNAPMGTYLEHSSFSGAKTDAMDLWKVAQLQMLIDTLNWTTDQAEGTVLLSIPVMPTFTNQTGSETHGLNVFYYEDTTFLSYIAQMFQYWRGSIQYRIDAVSSFFHTGRLLMTFEPNRATIPPTNMQQFTNNEGAVFDLKEKKSICVGVPFQSSVPRKTVVPYASVPATASKYTDQMILGTFRIVVLNRLTAPSNVPGEIDLNIYIGGGPDIEFEVPCLDPHVYFRIPAEPLEVRAEAQSESDVIPLRTDPEECFWLSKGAGNVSRMNVFNEGVRDVRELTRRHTLIHRVAIPMHFPFGIFDGSIQISASPYIFSRENVVLPGLFNANNTDFTSANSFHNRVARMYALYTGAMRYKIAPYSSRVSPIMMTATYLPNQGVWKPQNAFTSSTRLPSGYPTHMTNLSQQASLQVESPFFTGYNQLLIETLEPTTSFAPDTMRAGVVEIQASTYDEAALLKVGDDLFLPLDIWSASGDDMFFSYLVAPPRLWSDRDIVPAPSPP